MNVCRLSVCLSVHLSVSLPIHFPACSSICLCFHPSVFYLPVCSFNCHLVITQFVCLSLHLSISVCVCMFIYPTVCLSVHLSNSLFVCLLYKSLSICPFIHKFVCLSIFPSFCLSAHLSMSACLSISSSVCSSVLHQSVRPVLITVILIVNMLSFVRVFIVMLSAIVLSVVALRTTL
jgi:hypothetical protein